MDKVREFEAKQEIGDIVSPLGIIGGGQFDLKKAWIEKKETILEKPRSSVLSHG